jgi:hypothetical protein
LHADVGTIRLTARRYGLGCDGGLDVVPRTDPRRAAEKEKCKLRSAPQRAAPYISGPRRPSRIATNMAMNSKTNQRTTVRTWYGRARTPRSRAIAPTFLQASQMANSSAIKPRGWNVARPLRRWRRIVIRRDMLCQRKADDQPGQTRSWPQRSFGFTLAATSATQCSGKTSFALTESPCPR